VGELADKLKQQPEVAKAGLSVIFGSSSAGIAQASADLNRPRLRIGLWPILSSDAPETAMGLASVLAYLLERWQDVRLYRLIARVEGEPANYLWSLEQSQFRVDDWQLEGLDENIGVWGVLNKHDTRWKLTLEIESDLFEETEEVKTVTVEAEGLGQLIEALPGVASSVAEIIEAGEVQVIAPPVYTSVTGADEKLNNLLVQLFQWELNLLLHVWGKQQTDDKALKDADELLNTGVEVGDEFAAWAVSSAIARAMQPLFDPMPDLLAPIAKEVAASFPDSVFSAILLATALFRVNQVEAAYAMLEERAEAHPNSTEAWLALAELYRQGGYINEAVDTFQRAIEADAVSTVLYTRYGDLMVALDSQGWSVEEFILLNPQRRAADLMAWEAIEAYRAALELDPSNINALYRQTMLLADRQHESLWPVFRKLVEVDKTGDRVRSVIDSLYHIDDITPALQALEGSVQREPDRSDLYINLAAAYLVAEKGKLAEAALEKARSLTDGEDVHAEIDRLLLSARDPDFETRLGEITDLVSAGSSLSIQDVDFLEATLEEAPQFSEAYLLLAKAYEVWGDTDAALETLLDGQKHLPDDPDILERLARLLWEQGERKLAFDYLNRGLATNPQHVPLLAVTARYLFENEQEDAARAFLVRAEAIAPHHPALNETRIYIAKMHD
jgi:tetratricopeptide (TPR) repeat protein